MPAHLSVAAAVGGALVVLLSARLSAQRPEVALNHVYVTLDSATLAAVEASTLLADQFGGYRKQTNSMADGRSWTGVYIHGERTYVEFFPKGMRGGVGYSGLALSVEQPGAIDSVEAWLKGAQLPVVRELKRGMRQDKAFDWFHMIHVDHPRGDTLWQVFSWVMENHPEFYRVVLQDTTGPAADISRKRYLSRRFRPERLLRDVIGLRLHLRSPIAEQLRRELEALHWRVEHDNQRGGFRAAGPEAEIIVVPVAQGEPYGIREITFSVAGGPAQSQRHELGNSTLELSSTRARWTFGSNPR